MATKNGEKGSIVPKIILFGLAAVGAYFVLGFLFQAFSFVFSLTFWVLVLAVAIVAIVVSRRR